MNFFEVCKEAVKRYGSPTSHEESMFNNACFWNAYEDKYGYKPSLETISCLMRMLKDVPRFTQIGKAYWRWEHYLICA